MTDKEYIENIDKVDTDTLFENLEYYGFDSYYRDLWYATIGELKKRIEIRPQGEWVKVKEYRMSIDMSGEIATLYKCSECGRTIAILPSKLSNYPFCHCGADMRKGGAE